MRKQAALLSEPVSISCSSSAAGLPTALNSAGHRDASVLRDTDTTTSRHWLNDSVRSTAAASRGVTGTGSSWRSSWPCQPW